MKKIIYIILLSILIASTAFSESNIKEEKEVKILPLGSVVKLYKAKEGRELMIIARGVLSVKNGVEGYYDYAGCRNVIGFVDNEYFYFNNEDIEKIYFKGYVDELEVKYQKMYEEKIDSIPYPKLKTN